MQVKIKKLHPDAKTPTYGTEGAACFDLYAAAECAATNKYDTGLAFEIPDSHAMLVFSRSGFGFKNNATLSNAVGIVDSDFRGSVQVKYSSTIPAGVGDRIAQAMIIPVEQVTFQEVEELSETTRGDKGFGSTGVK